MSSFKQKILVTGGAGYIGSHFLHFLVSKGVSPKEIIVFDNLERGFINSIPKGINLIKGDLRKKNQILKLFQKEEIDLVVHFAAYAYVDESVKNPGKYFENNLFGGLNLLEAMRLGGCKKIIFSSSCASYGIPDQVPITESQNQSPINPYGETKKIFEIFLRWYDQIYGVKSVCLRYFNAAGADFGIGEKHNPETHLIPKVLQAIFKGDPVYVFGTDYLTKDGSCVRDYIHVTDLANAHFLAMDYLKDSNNKSIQINLGTGKGTSVKEMIKIAEKVLEKKAKVILSERRPGDPAKLIADARKAKKILKWEPKKSIQEIISDAAKWEKRKIDLNKNERV